MTAAVLSLFGDAGQASRPSPVAERSASLTRMAVSVPPAPASGVHLKAEPARRAARVSRVAVPAAQSFTCAGCGEVRSLVDLYGGADQLGLLQYCAPCAAPQARSHAAQGLVAKAVVADAEAGHGTMLDLAAQLAGHLSELTVRREARKSGTALKHPAEGTPTTDRFWRVAGRLLVPYLATPRTWAELEGWAESQGFEHWVVRELLAWLEGKGDAVAVRDGEDAWRWVVADDDAEDATDEGGDAAPWWASLPGATLRAGGHATNKR